MANRKNSEKLPVPNWFKRSSYKDVINLSKPLDWLKQIAFRIDLKNFWHEIAREHAERIATGKCDYFSGDFAFDLIFELIQHRPILSVDQLVARHRGEIDFATVSLVKRGVDPIRPMTPTDFLLVYASMDPQKRKLMRDLINAIDQDAPYPIYELRSARIQDNESHARKPAYRRTSNKAEVFARHRDRVLSRLSQLKRGYSHVSVANSILSNEWDGSKGDFLEESVADHTPQGFARYVALDADTPYSQAKKTFEKQFRAYQSKSHNGKTTWTRIFGSWRRNGILPYIDLFLYSTIEATSRNNSKIAINDSDIAEHIYSGKKDPQRVSETTRPVAEALMDPTSSLFRQLLRAAHF